MKLRIVPEAETETLEAANWYDDQQPGLGDRFFDAVCDSLDAILAHPLRFGRVETVRAAATVRRARVAEFPYTMVFDLQADEIVVLAVAHMSRRPGYWRKRK